MELTREPNSILTEIRDTRDEMARAAGFNVRKFMDGIRNREREAAARGVSFVSPAPAVTGICILREEPPRSIV